MLGGRVALCWWWPLARLRLCLASVDDLEVRRLLTQRLRWLVMLSGGAAFFVVLGVQAVHQGLSAPPSGAPGASASGSGSGSGGTADADDLPGTLPFAIAYFAAVALLLVASLALWLYCRRKARRALRDREGDPEVCRGLARRVLTARDGGWPILIRTDRGRSLWLTGSPRSLGTIKGRLGARRPDRRFQLVVVVTYYPRCRVIREVTGMAVESLELAAVRAPAGAEPA
jgi:hypothetical protein